MSMMEYYETTAQQEEDLQRIRAEQERADALGAARCYIKEQVPRAELLAQLAEEGAELTHAALKLRRVIDGTNPTPVSLEDGVNALMEEVADVLLLIQLMNLDRDEEDIQNAMEYKTNRWADRLKEKEGKK